MPNIEFGGPAVTRMAFDNANRTLDWSALGSCLDHRATNFTHRQLAHLNLNDPPWLHHVKPLGFNFDAGWSKSQANLARDADWVEAAVVGVRIVSLGGHCGASLVAPAWLRWWSLALQWVPAHRTPLASFTTT